jgi:hypothetical protein
LRDEAKREEKNRDRQNGRHCAPHSTVRAKLACTYLIS